MLRLDHLDDSSSLDSAMRPCSVIRHAEQGGTPPNPVVLVDLAGQVEHEDEVSRVTRRRQLTLPGARLVERALEVLAWREHVVWTDLNRLEPNDGELDERNLRVGVFDALLGAVPFAALNVETVELDTNFR